MAAAACFDIDIIVAAIEVEPGGIAGDRYAGRRLAILGVKIHGVFGKAGNGHVIDIGIERAHVARAFVGDVEARRAAVGHGEIAIERLAGRAGQIFRLVVEI